jgi:23S rRNA pseudouridine2605 synthase
MNEHNQDKPGEFSPDEGRDAPGSVRLQKFLALAGLGARRKMELVIAAGRVTVNGATASLGAKVNPDADSVKLDGRRIRLPDSHLYLALHKPPHTLTAKSDDRQRPLVMELLPEKMRGRLHPVGRLDFDSEGLLLFTSDGELTLRLTHPRYKLMKTYWVKIKGHAEERDLDKVRRGMVIDGRKTQPLIAQRAAVRIGKTPATDNEWIEVRMLEGRKNQIRELFFRVGHPVIRLMRKAVGPVFLGDLPPGASRLLTPDEVRALKTAPPAPQIFAPKRQPFTPGGPSGVRAAVEKFPKPEKKKRVEKAAPRKPRKAGEEEAPARKYPGKYRDLSRQRQKQQHGTGGLNRGKEGRKHGR